MQVSLPAYTTLLNNLNYSATTVVSTATVSATTESTAVLSTSTVSTFVLSASVVAPVEQLPQLITEKLNIIAKIKAKIVFLIFFYIYLS